MPHHWTKELSLAYRTPQDLFDAGLINKEDVPSLTPILKRYQFLLPRYYAKLIDRTDPHCPIRLQAIPSAQEAAQAPEWEQDPLSDLHHQPAPHVTHRYRDRALIHLTPNCSMYCRYCFRKTLLNDLKADLFGGEISSAILYLRDHSEIREVIFSGGDPLMSPDKTLSKVLAEINQIPSVKRVRFHTRVPVTFPNRITEDLLSSLSVFSGKKILVTHFNHPRELTPESINACRKLSSALVLLNQSVLLKGVNDKVEVLEKLSGELFETGILPYYLHHPDQSQGTQHFDVSRAQGLEIYRSLKSRISGYLVPRYVVDEVGRPYKKDVCDQSSVPV